MKEKLLQYIWQFQYFNKNELTTMDGDSLGIIHSGSFNTNQGPDFLEAKIKIDITKHMLKDPRRVGQIDVTVHFPPLHLDEEQKAILEFTGNNCPVAKSLHQDLKTNIEYNW